MPYMALLDPVFRYIVTSLEEPIQEYCTEHVSPSNAIQWLVAADTHMLEGLRAMLLDRAMSLYEEIVEEAPDTLNLLDSHPKLMRELLRSALTSPAAKRSKTGT